MARFLLSAFADEISPVFTEQIEGVKALGISMIELRGVDGKSFTQLDDDGVKRVKKLLCDNNIGLSALGSPLGKITCDDDMDAHLALANRIMDIGEALDCRRIRMFSFYRGKSQTEQEFKTEALRRVGLLLDLAEKRGFTLYHENEKDILGESPDAEYDMLRYFGGRLKAVLDPGNFAYCHLDGSGAYGLMRDYIGYCHIKDCDADGCIVPTGKGVADIAGVVRQINASVNGDFILTVEPHLTDFVGLTSLAADTLEHKYTFETPFAAFEYATNALKDIIAKL